MANNLKDSQNFFAEGRFRYIEVLFHLFYYFWGKENCSFCRVLRFIEGRYIQVQYREENEDSKDERGCQFGRARGANIFKGKSACFEDEKK